MKRSSYLFVVVLILCQLSLSPDVVNRFRSMAVATIAPPWRLLSHIKHGFIYATTIWPWGGYRISPEVQKEVATLKLENHQLRQQVELLKVQGRLEELSQPAVVGQVIFREAASWSSTLWINLGQKTNASWGKEVLAKHSPVVVGTALVGIVEYVGQNRSRVRLITDALLTPSVVVLRNGTYLARGEIQGVRSSHFRARAAKLRGSGFSGDLQLPQALIQKEDLLVTTGMDGVFPAGLEVAEVSLVYPLSEGASSFEVEASPRAGNLDDLSFVMVLPPLYDFAVDEDR